MAAPRRAGRRSLMSCIFLVLIGVVILVFFVLPRLQGKDGDGPGRHQGD
jgi:hypothetical protein